MTSDAHLAEKRLCNRTRKRHPSLAIRTKSPSVQVGWSWTTGVEGGELIVDRRCEEWVEETSKEDALSGGPSSFGGVRGAADAVLKRNHRLLFATLCRAHLKTCI